MHRPGSRLSSVLLACGILISATADLEGRGVPPSPASSSLVRQLNELALDELWSELIDPAALRALLTLARDEDLGRGLGSGVGHDQRHSGDVTSQLAIEAGRRGRALLRPRSAGVVAGLRAVPTVVELFGFRGSIEVGSIDGSACAAGEVLAVLDGDLREILALERTLLNLLSRLCGVATATHRFVDAVAGTRARICDTRKTTPGFRALEKYAVRCGGGWLHRLGLHDAVLVKDNHLAGVSLSTLAERVAALSVAARARGGIRFVEIEVDTLEQLAVLLRLPPGVVDMILLDNMDPPALRRAVAMRGERPTPLLEASGGVTLSTVRAIAETGVDRISTGAITHSAGILDLGLDLEAERTES